MIRKYNTLFKAVSILLLVFMLLSYSFRTKPPALLEGKVSVFPLSLISVFDEAFADTEIEIALFQEKLEFIGTRIFYNTLSLTDASIPESVRFIGNDAFTVGVLIRGVENSYAQSWAEENGFIFVVDAVWNGRIETIRLYINGLTSLLYLLIPCNIYALKGLRRRTEEYIKSMRPQDRPELYPINYRFP